MTQVNNVISRSVELFQMILISMVREVRERMVSFESFPNQELGVLDELASFITGETIQV